MFYPNFKDPINSRWYLSTTERYVNDSERFWRKEFNPRFKDIFTIEDFKKVFDRVNESLSFPLDQTQIDVSAEYFWFLMAGYRFIAIPTKNPYSIDQFLAELFFTLKDNLQQLSFSDYPLTKDDFNVVTNGGETAKIDGSKVGTDERNKQASRNGNTANILTQTDLSTQDTTNVENIKEEIDTNTKSVQDQFLSPQNQGVKPNLLNKRHKGVDGFTLAPDDTYTNATINENQGSSDLTHRNTIESGTTSESAIQQNNDITTSNESTNEMVQGQLQENTAQQSDKYSETLFFDRAKKLAEYYELSSENVWLKIINRLSPWILQADIATADTNYVGYPKYE